MSKDKIIIEFATSSFLTSFRFGNGCKQFTKEITKHLVYSSLFLQSQLNEVQISGLFNGFSEESFVQKIHGVGHDVKSLFPLLYSDSGGLQILTRSSHISKEMRQQVYRIQAENSHFAFSFDSLPFSNLNGSMIYQPSIVGECGTEAGINLKRQIEHFCEVNSGAKIIPIVQGMGLTDLSLYARNMLAQLDNHQLENLDSCLALGGLIFLGVSHLADKDCVATC